MKGTDIKKWTYATMIRTVRTMAQAAVASIGSTAMFTDVNWVVVGSTTLMAGILCVLTSIATGLPEVDAKEE